MLLFFFFILLPFMVNKKDFRKLRLVNALNSSIVGEAIEQWVAH